MNIETLREKLQTLAHQPGVRAVGASLPLDLRNSPTIVVSQSEEKWTKPLSFAINFLQAARESDLVIQNDARLRAGSDSVYVRVISPSITIAVAVEQGHPFNKCLVRTVRKLFKSAAG